MTAARWVFTRRVEETYAELLTVTLTADQLVTLGYASASDAAENLATADVRLVVPALEVSLTATVTATVSGTGVVMLMAWTLPTSLTDVAQDHACYVVHEQGSPVGERVLCEGAWVVLAREED